MSHEATDGATLVAKLAPLRAHAGTRRTPGLDDATIARFAGYPDLIEAIDAAAAEYARIKGDFADLLDQDEDAQVHAVQAGYINFYPDDAVNPYVALVARGPWIITLKGDALVTAVDDAGNVSSPASCLVPPPPK